MRDLSAIYDGQRLQAYSRLIAFAFMVTLAVLWATSAGLLDPYGKPLGADFITFWSAGRLSLDGNATGAFDRATIFAMQRQAVPGTDAVFMWNYPPTFQLVAAGLAAMPYVLSYFVFVAAGLAAFLVVLRPLVPWREAGIVLLALPGTFICVMHGQNSLISAALLAGAITLIDRRPVVAGICIGLLAFKPQLGIMFPLVLALTGRWRVMGVAAATTIVFAGAATLVFGLELWSAFLHNLPVVRQVMESGQLPWGKMPSAWVFVRKLGAGEATAYTAQTIVACSAVAATLHVWWRCGPTLLAGAVLVSGTMLLSPYTFDYEMAIMAVPLAIIAQRLVEQGAGLFEKVVLLVLAMSPLFMGTPVDTTGLQLGFVALTATFVWSARMALETVEVGAKDVRVGGAGPMMRPLS